MNAPHLDLPIGSTAGAIGNALEAATTSAGSIIESAAELSERVASQATTAVEDRRRSALTLIVGVAAVAAAVAMIVSIRRRRDRDHHRRETETAAPN